MKSKKFMKSVNGISKNMKHTTSKFAKATGECLSDTVCTVSNNTVKIVLLSAGSLISVLNTPANVIRKTRKFG